MAHWFYRIEDGREFGPIGSSQLLELIRQGHVASETEVRKDDSPWVRACEVNGLWQAVGLPTVKFRCPHCEAEIEKPPTRCSACQKPVAKAVGSLVRHSRPQAVEREWTQVERVSQKPKAPPLQ
jgi:uncharacterized protein with PIN domain